MRYKGIAAKERKEHKNINPTLVLPVFLIQRSNRINFRLQECPTPKKYSLGSLRSFLAENWCGCQNCISGGVVDFALYSIRVLGSFFEAFSKVSIGAPVLSYCA